MLRNIFHDFADDLRPHCCVLLPCLIAPVVDPGFGQGGAPGFFHNFADTVK